MDLENPKNPDGEDKFMAAVAAVFLLLFSIFSIFVIFSLSVALWDAGIITAIIIVGALAGLFAIGRALYHAILEKDIL